MEYRVIYYNTLSKAVTVFTQPDTGTGRFYTFPIPEGLGSGEYEYFVAEAGGELVLHPNDVRQSTVDGHRIKIYDCGVAQVGTIQRADTTYNTEKIYEQYK